MAYKKDSPFKDETIKHMATYACYAEIAQAAGPEWDPTKLEVKIDKGKYGSYTNCYRRLLNGIAPGDKRAEILQNKYGNKCDIKIWRDHPFWPLLKLQPLTHKEIEDALLSINSNIKHNIWVDIPDKEFIETTRFPRYEPTNVDIERIAKYKSWDALVTLVAYAREARDRSMTLIYYRSARQVRTIFPHVVTKYPQLYICWETLADRLTKIIWRPKLVFSSEPQIKVSLQDLRKEIKPLAETARKRGICLPPEEFITKHGQ